ncbi:hypothetical protein CS022_02615 [Veronia nyctiphanis]|uniref:Major outer membrane lipoprotein Lpp n=1 Tax=Veronia nyctiphanis TaxID=1278244 RepID=A0A4Q0YUM3_9GAMM|nr:Lpp/OprI family alanine-zipper lipoprotein [Veronia nyctiphanis]RXJ74493.1 hypothetical protein CS022_02615 [Veronia nyctiphanis]
MKKRLLALAPLVSCALLAGCSSSSGVEKSVAGLSAKVYQLSSQVDQLTEQLEQVSEEAGSLKGGIFDAKATSDLAYDEATRANERIDLMSQSIVKSQSYVK